MWSYVIISVVVAIVSGLLAYLDSRLFDRPKKRMTYIKIMLMNVVVVLSTISVLTWLAPTNNIKEVMQSAGAVSKIDVGPVVRIAQLGETMLDGPPPF